MTMTAVDEALSPVRVIGRRGRMFKRMRANVLVMTGGSIAIVLVLMSIVGPWLVPFGPMDVEPAVRLTEPNGTHWFGTDNYGRDLAARVFAGARVSLIVGFLSALFASIMGLAVGLVAAHNRVADAIIMRVMDGLMAFPSILLAIAIMVALGPDTMNIVAALSFVFAPYVARIVRSTALVIKEQAFVEALRAQQASWWRILWINIAPNVASPLIVQATFIFADAIIVEAALSFLGAGVPPPTASWGNILLDGKTVIFTGWWMTLFPGVAIMLTVLGINMLGDGLRDVLDPKYGSRS